MMDHIPREALRNPIKFELSSIHNYVMRRLLRTHEKAANGLIDKDHAPGYGIQVKIAMGILERTAPVPRFIEPENAARPVQIAIVLQTSSHADAGLPPGSLRVHLQGVNGDTGNGGVRDAGRREDVGGVRDDDCSRPEAS